MVNIAVEANGSKPVISVLTRRVIVPPYCGFPRLSHQFPAVVEVVFAVDTVVVVVLGAVAVSEVVDVVAWV
jgi:hypothetical protein